MSERNAWDALVQAYMEKRPDEGARAYRNGLLDMFSAMTGEDAEAVYERVSDECVARVERAIAEGE